MRDQTKIMLKGVVNGMLTSSPIFIGFVISVLSGGNLLIFCLGTFVAGFTGLIIIFQRESPSGIVTIRGTRAIVEGVIITIICWGSAIILLVEGLKLKP